MVAQVLYTIGYEGSSVETFGQALEDAGVGRVIDIRQIPVSRKRGFSKKSLLDEMDCRGIEYIHIRALGNPKPGREAARRGDMSRFQLIYRYHLRSGEAQAALEHIVLMALESVCCLLCFERDHANCHRDIVVEAMKKKKPFTVKHLRVGNHGERDHFHETCVGVSV